MLFILFSKRMDGDVKTGIGQYSQNSWKLNKQSKDDLQYNLEPFQAV